METENKSTFTEIVWKHSFKIYVVSLCADIAFGYYVYKMPEQIYGTPLWVIIASGVLAYITFTSFFMAMANDFWGQNQDST